jgi:uncharacterized protein (DUF885 family)
VGLAAAALDDYLARNPVAASLAGDTRFDARLPDYTGDGVAEQVRVLNRHLLALDSIDPVGLSRNNAVDLAILRNQLTLRVHRLRVLDEPVWNPLWWSPALALEPLLARPEPPVAAILARLGALPEFLEIARTTLRAMPRAHLELALAEVGATPGWLADAVAQLSARVRVAGDQLGAAAASAAVALHEHRQWLASQRPAAVPDARLGPRRYGEVFALLLGQGLSYEEVKRQAEEELAELGEQLRSLSSRLLGRSLATRRLVPTALAAVSDEYTLSPVELVPAAQRSLAAASAFAVECKLVTVPQMDIEVVGMPPVRAGRAAAFSELRGGPVAGGLPMRVAVTGPDPRWAPRRRASFLREYNALMLDALMSHQGVPGHALQTAHAQSVVTPTAVRTVFPDQVFAEGWAVHAQTLMTDHGYPGSVPGSSAAAFALQELKLRMRGVANALLDIGFHTGELDEPQARRLLATAAMAEEGEFVVKWRKVRTTFGALSTYFVGHRAVRQLVADVAASSNALTTRQVHDRVLMHGAVPPPAARDLLGLD